ncbi:MAG: phosphopantetheine-binding protein [Myxococcota bacterium]|jgi:acyl carrier protein|nr:phosphopantetheine-binding protein [Myxococcota bacterium]
MKQLDAVGTIDLEVELKDLIIEALVLEDVTPEEIVSEDPLFGEGLGLDSIDALEIGMALELKYGIITGEDPDEDRTHFSCVRSLAAFVSGHRTK